MIRKWGWDMMRVCRTWTVRNVCVYVSCVCARNRVGGCVGSCPNQKLSVCLYVRDASRVRVPEPPRVHSRCVYSKKSMRRTAIVIADIHASETLKDVRYGYDSPFSLLNATLRNAAAVESQPALVLVLGDLVAHHARSAAAAAATFEAVTARIRGAFPMSTHGGCGLAIGNNDVHPDYAVPAGVYSKGTAFYAAQASAVRDLCGLDTLAFTSLRELGYYSTEPLPGLRLLTLNTDVYSLFAEVGGGGAAEPTNATDPLDQFRWIDLQLAAAASDGAQAIVLGHIPPIVDTFTRAPLWRADYAREYWRLMSRHAPVIAGQLFGHIHSDQFRVWGGGGGAALDAPPLMTMASVSPIFGNNPAFYTLDLGEAEAVGEAGGSQASSGRGAQASYRLEDVSCFYHDISLRVNSSGPSGEDAGEEGATSSGEPVTVTFVPLYHARTTYGLSAITNRAYAQLARGFANASSTSEGGPLWSEYFRDFKTKSGDPRVTSHGCDGETPGEIFGFCHNCTGGCRRAFACLLLDGRSAGSYAACLRAAGLLAPPIFAELAATSVACATALLLCALAAACSRRSTRRRRQAAASSAWREHGTPPSLTQAVGGGAPAGSVSVQNGVWNEAGRQQHVLGKGRPLAGEDSQAAASPVSPRSER